MARPAFGEKWATGWLDLARYSDTHGYQDDLPRTMWPWRDWVIKAFNENMPYDRFVTWQLAGDPVPPPIYISANMPGAAQQNAALIERYRTRNPHL